MADDTLIKTVVDGVATLTVNRPAARNALTREMALQLTDELLRIEQDADIKCLVLRGANGSFIAGGDLVGFSRALEMSPSDRSIDFRRRVSSYALQMSVLMRMPKPVVAVVEGAVAGAGIPYALAADYVLAAEDARFLLSHVNVGLPLDLGLSYFLPRVVGLGHARRLAMTGATVLAAEALTLGMVSELAPASQIDEALQRITQRLAAMPQRAIVSIKREFEASYDNSLCAQIALEAELVAECVADEAFVQRVRAFVNRKRG